MTGRAAGFCAGYGVPGFANGGGMGRGFGSGFGGGRGGRGWRNRFYAAAPGPVGWQQAAMAGQVPAAAITQEQELDMLKNQAQQVQQTLQQIQQRIDTLQNSDT